MEMGTGSGDACLSPRPLSRSEERGPERPISLPASSFSVHEHLAKGSAMAVALMPSNFFHPVWLGRRPTQASSGPGRRPESRPGAPVCRVGPSRPTVDTDAARSRPLAAKAPGSEWGRGEVAARKRTVPARRALRAGLGTHRARGARGPGAAECP